MPLGFFIGGPFNAAQHIARQPAPQCLAPWPPGRGRQTCFGPLNILKGTRDHICLNPSAMLCFHTLSCTIFSDSRQTPVPRGHYCVKSAMFFSHAIVRQSQTPGLRVRYYDKSVMLKKNPSSNLFRGPSTISDGIPTQLAGPEPPPKNRLLSDRNSDPASWAPKPPKHRSKTKNTQTQNSP